MTFPLIATPPKKGIVEDNLALHLDMGNSSTYSGTGQDILDLTANNFDFFRGTSNSATTDDPTFNGSAGGLSASEFFSFDGGDTAQAQAAYAGSILRTMFRDDVPFSFEIWLQIGSTTGVQNYFANAFASSTNGGYIGISQSTTGKFAVRPVKPEVIHEADTTLSTGTWMQLGVSGICDNATTGLFVLNGASDGTFVANSTYTSGDSATVATLAGRVGDSGLRPSSGTKIAIVRVYDVALTEAQFFQNFQAQRNRFSL